MLANLVQKIVGTRFERDLKRLQPVVDQINALEKKIQVLTDDELRQQTQIFRDQLSGITDKEIQKKKLNEMLPQAFAVCREASKRVLNMRHFDVQLIGGMTLHEGKIAEMRTGEGKTLVATLPVYLNALLGRGVHLVTVNDYLAKRDAAWMGQLYQFLGLTVGVIVHDMPDVERKAAYACDVTYGQNNEFGFDYLRDNMKYRLEDYVQRDLYFAIVDEVDSILVDEARTPLIISGPTEDSTDKYHNIDKIIPLLKKDVDYAVEEKSRQVMLTEMGITNVEKALNIENLYDPNYIELVHHVNQALRAHTLYTRDVDYVVRDGQVIIVDEFTGRLMSGRRWSDGLHQAVEAKENVKIENENQTLASITFQNYFRMFEKLAGMTGTADTEAEEFDKIYNLDVRVIPTNKPMIRKDNPDVIYRTVREKMEAMVKQAKELHEKGQPVLIGTISIEKSELLSKFLQRGGVKHNVLNAKQHEREAEIVKDAGQKGMVTIATNMAGRGTDIVLGEGVRELGGLFIMGSERHESRRIDNQLRGRSGRQGDPGESRFYLSLEDDLMRIFANDWVQKMLDWAGMEEGEAIEHKWTSKSIETAQRRVEGHNFDIRKHLLKYDDVMNQQRKVIYSLRKNILSKPDISELIQADIEQVVEEMVLSFAPEKQNPIDWNWAAISEASDRIFDVKLDLDASTLSPKNQQGLYQTVLAKVQERYKNKETEMPVEILRMLEREIKLRTIDTMWKDHLLNMDHVKESVGFEGYAQKDPLVVYQKRGFEMFSEMISVMKEQTVGRLFHVQLAQQPEQMEESIQELQQHAPQKMQLIKPEAPEVTSPEAEIEKTEVVASVQSSHSHAPVLTMRRQGEKTGRNDPCPCGSGKKFKKCHGEDLTT